MSATTILYWFLAFFLNLASTLRNYHEGRNPDLGTWLGSLLSGMAFAAALYAGSLQS